MDTSIKNISKIHDEPLDVYSGPQLEPQEENAPLKNCDTATNKYNGKQKTNTKEKITEIT